MHAYAYAYANANANAYACMRNMHLQDAQSAFQIDLLGQAALLMRMPEGEDSREVDAASIDLDDAASSALPGAGGTCRWLKRPPLVARGWRKLCMHA